MAEIEKKYTPREEFFNTVTHLAGALASAAGIFYLLQCRMVKNEAWGMAAGVFYGASLIFMFGGSALYHACPRHLFVLAGAALQFFAIAGALNL